MKTQKAIDAISRGGFLMAEYDAEDQSLKYRCIPGGGVTPNQAKTIIKSLDLKPQADALFADMIPQTWRPEMAEKSCADCKYSKPYDQWLTEIRMCAAPPVSSARTCAFAREHYGACGPDGKLFEARP